MKLRLWLHCLFLGIAAGFPALSWAKWQEASSEHFVIFADESTYELRQFSDQLERFHAAMAFVLKVEAGPAPSPSNRVTIYVVKSDHEVRKLADSGNSLLYAYYVPRAGGSLAIVPKVDTGSRELDFSMIALLHEYAHHFQLSGDSYASPPWFVEGSAEFFSSARFDHDGTVAIGLAANHRAGDLLYAQDVSATDLLDPVSYEKKKHAGWNAFYGKSWLLYHYLTFAPERRGQLVAYLDAVRHGSSSIDAARAVFGDLGQLEADIRKYLRQPTITTISLKPGLLHTGPVTMRPLSEGEAAMMPIRIRSRNGVSAEEAKALLPDARAVAARFPRDAAVLAALAEAEADAEQDDAAIAAADAAIAIDSSQVNAYVQKGKALFHKAETAGEPVKAFRDARVPFLALNKIENDNPLPLIYYYQSFTRAGLAPPQKAVQALERALQLAPFDLGLRSMVVSQEINDRRYAEAMVNLAPIAFNPHGGESAERARRLLEQLKAGETPNAMPLELPSISTDLPKGRETARPGRQLSASSQTPPAAPAP